MRPAAVEALERDTVAAVAPPEILRIGDWLVPLDHGTIGRAKSAVPLSHDIGPEAIDEVAAAYRDHGLKPAFRIADVPSLAAVRDDLTARGFAPVQPTIFKTGNAVDLAELSAAPAHILPEPDNAWAAVFLGDGFDHADGAHRIAALARSPGAVYGAAGEGGETQGVGVMSFGATWAGIHGMRTAPAHRGKGVAAAVLAALGREALSRGVERVFLQVEEDNPARRLYRRAGFSAAWRYHYWR